MYERTLARAEDVMLQSRNGYEIILVYHQHIAAGKAVVEASGSGEDLVIHEDLDPTWQIIAVYLDHVVIEAAGRVQGLKA